VAVLLLGAAVHGVVTVESIESAGTTPVELAQIAAELCSSLRRGGVITRTCGSTT